GKWTEIKGPESLDGKGWAVRQGQKNDFGAQRHYSLTVGAEGVNMQ
ncbi:MAG: hypothetical protein QOH01_2509, partial [Verrucomicrobiota bacterium]